MRTHNALTAVIAVAAFEARDVAASSDWTLRFSYTQRRASSGRAYTAAGA